MTKSGVDDKADETDEEDLNEVAPKDGVTRSPHDGDVPAPDVRRKAHPAPPTQFEDIRSRTPKIMSSAANTSPSESSSSQPPWLDAALIAISVAILVGIALGFKIAFVDVGVRLSQSIETAYHGSTSSDAGCRASFALAAAGMTQGLGIRYLFGTLGAITMIAGAAFALSGVRSAYDLGVSSSGGNSAKLLVSSPGMVLMTLGLVPIVVAITHRQDYDSVIEVCTGTTVVVRPPPEVREIDEDQRAISQDTLDFLRGFTMMDGGTDAR